jgi:hypothetical protein
MVRGKLLPCASYTHAVRTTKWRALSSRTARSPASLKASNRPAPFATNARLAETAGVEGRSAPLSSVLVQVAKPPSVDASKATRVPVDDPPSHRVTTTVPPTAVPDSAGPSSCVPPSGGLCFTAPPYSSRAKILLAPDAYAARKMRPSEEAAGGPNTDV